MTFIAAKDRPESPAFITPWTYVHFLIGVVAYTVYKDFFPNMSPFLAAAILTVFHGLYELRDVLLARESSVNAVGDQTFVMLGFYAGHLVAGFLKDANLIVYLLLVITYDVFVRAGFE